MATNQKAAARTRRHARLRKKVRGTAERPRLAVYRSNVGTYAQLVDDRTGRTVAAASTLDADLNVHGAGKKGAAKAVGKLIAERAQAAGITRVVFDRGGNRYMGRVAALADGAREAGLEL